MFFAFKKRTLLITLVVIALVLCSAGAFAIAREAASPGIRKVVVVDVGHGGADGGVSGVNSNVKESEINLSVALLLKTELENLGYKTILTRTDGGSADGGKEYDKKADMAARKKIIEKYSPLCVVSVHCNKFPSPGRRGAQVFYNKFSEEGKTLAFTLQSELNALNVQNAGREFAALAGDYYILNCSSFPSAIVECGFLSNPEDETLLLSAEYQRTVACTVAQGIHRFLMNY